jgi:hypothetical protein
VRRVHNVGMRFASACAIALVAAFGAACNSSTSPSATTSSFSGTFTGQMIVTTSTGAIVCLSTRTLNGSLTMTLQLPTSGTTVTGTATTTGTVAETAVSPAGICATLPATISLNGSRSVTGTTSSLTFSSTSAGTSFPGVGGGSVTCTDTIAFTGALAGSAVTGTLVYTTACQGNNGVTTIIGTGTTAIPVALR